MADVRANYFTCTLGQALELESHSNGGLPPFKTVIDLIDGQAERIPDTFALGFARLTSKNESDSGQNKLTFKDLRDRSLLASQALHRDVGSPSGESPGRVVAVLCTSSIDFALTWLGLMRLGWSVLLLAPQLEPDAIRHLCTSLKAQAIFVDKAHQETVSSLTDTFDVLGVDSRLISDGYDSDTVHPAAYQVSKTACIFHTSGTSSGLPKPIFQSQHGAVGALPQFSEEHQPATFSATPLYHGGLADCFRAWTSGAMVWFFPEGVAPITGANLVKAIESARNENIASVQYFSSVPFVLQMLAEDKEGLKLLKSMDLVGVGGAALADAVGDRLVKAGVHLLSRMGSAECGFLMSSHRDYEGDHDWQYLRPISDTDLLSFEPRENGLSELIVKPGWPFRAKTNRDDGSYATSDLFEPHPSRENAWRYHSRADAQITLANGKKFDPAPIESSILTSTNILQDVLVFGNGQPYAGALLFASGRSFEDSLLETVWRHLESMNKMSQNHARISRSMLTVVPVEEGRKALDKSSKGTVLRRQAEERYAEAIQAAYDGKGGQPSDSEPVSDENLFSAVIDCFLTVTGRQVDPEDDLYHQGVDSIACIQVRKLLESTCLPDNAGPLPGNVVYDQGTIAGVVKYLRQVRRGTLMPDAEKGETQLKLMETLASKYSDFDFHLTKQPSRSKDGHVVVMTGATGFLGAHILDQLRLDRNVKKVYCLLRASTPFAAHERVRKSLLNRGLPHLEEYGQPSQKGCQISCLPCELSNTNLGLSEEDKQAILNEATVFIHSAWAVNFSLRLESFEDQIASTRNLIMMAAHCSAKMHFISSTASVVSSKSAIIPERLSLNPSEASPMGYSQSKWVAERVCSEANKSFHKSPTKTQQDEPFVSIIRVGQLCGNAAGVWNMSEAYPLMLSTTKFTECLPILRNEPLGWIPVEVAAKAVLDIVFSGLEAEFASTPVYHILNPNTSPKWEQMLDWVKDGADEPSFEAVEPSEWVNRLEEALKSRNDGHPAQALLEMWKRGYCKDLKLEKDTDQTDSIPPFDVSETQQVSETMRGVQPLDRERLLKIWQWIRESTKR